MRSVLLEPVPRRPRRRGPARAVIRFVAAVMTTSGVLLLADAGVTLAWQEPVSAVIAMMEQSELEGELNRRFERPPRAARDDRLTPRELQQLADDYEDEVAEGEAWGRIDLPTLDSEYVVVEGTSESSLMAGPGHYPDTALPGEDATVAIAGHRTTYLAPFRTIDQLGEGDEIVIEMPWADFTYEFEEQLIVEPDQTEVTNTVGHERLVLTACHPLYSASQRIAVFAKLTDVEPRGEKR